MNLTIDIGKIRWKCRRGMLELDIILENFYEQQFQMLTDEEKILFSQLLDEPDPLLYNWLLRHNIVHDSKFDIILGRILSNRQENGLAL